MTTTDPYILEARELLMEWGIRPDHVRGLPGLASILRERPVYTREQELEAMRAALTAHDGGDYSGVDVSEALDAWKRHLTAPKVDPLSDWLKSEGYDNPGDAAERQRKFLAARGLEIREVGDG